jgi:hypothetical protein
MIKYSIRARVIADIITDIKRRRLIISPYFQRDFVWRTVHKIDFIDTILRGFPFPQIFLAKGDVDVETMTLTACVVDGQQRLNAILGYIEGQFSVSGKTYSELEIPEKEEFLKYEVPTIELDLKHDDPSVIEIFKRLNRTFYSLSNIERLSTEYASSEFMLLAKLLAGDLYRIRPQPLLDFIPDADEELPTDVGLSSAASPIIPESFFDWASQQVYIEAQRYLLEEKIFTGYEISRKVHLMFILNVLATLERGFYARNEMVPVLLDNLADEYPDKDERIKSVERACKILNELDFPKGSYWNNKANAFSLLVLLASNQDELDALELSGAKARLNEFSRQPHPTYAISAKEAVNNKRERIFRNDFLEYIIFERMPKDLADRLNLDELLDQVSDNVKHP